MGSGSELTRFAWFSWYLNRLNSDFDPWAIFLKGIQYFLQWNWFYPDRIIGSIVNFWSPQKSTLGQIWSKLTKSSNNFGFDIETWKFSFWWNFDQFCFSVNSGWLRAFWSLWLEIALWALWHLIRLNHNNLDVSTVPRWTQWKINFFFYRIFGVQHANWEWKKCGINKMYRPSYRMSKLLYRVYKISYKIYRFSHKNIQNFLLNVQNFPLN